MKTYTFAFAFWLAFSSVLFAQSAEINIIPKPTKVTANDGFFSISRKTQISIEDSFGQRGAELLNKFLREKHGFSLKVVKDLFSRKKDNVVIFKLLPHTFPETGRYNLAITPRFIYIDGNNFYALQSLFQLMPNQRNKVLQIPSVVIEDEPRFPYRGMHLDVARHFMPVSFVKKFIDLMSQHKFNYFHWHLTEDQGWRIEIKRYPRLTEIGSKRPETVKERNLTPYIGDGIPVEGFYTQEQIRDVVAYAKARYITVIPEIELPGHASAALAAYPQFGCKADYKYKVQTTWGIFKEVYCPTDETFKFLEDILDETIALFPDSPYIHIGGDEVLKDHWKESAFVQELMNRENLKDEHEVQSYFVRRIEKYINSKGKKMIGWDEILEGGLAPNATVMSWRGMRGGIEAAKAKHDVIMTPTDYVYFDYGQGDPAYEPLNIGSYVPLEKVYRFEPVPKELTPDEAKYVIGAQGNIWTEYMKSPSHVEYMAFPRMMALAEVVWSQPDKKDFADFNRRLAAHLPRLDSQNVNYRIPEPTGLKNVVVGADGKASINLATAIGTKIHYTLDGRTPDEKSPVYEKPIVVELKQDEKVELKTVVVNAKGRKSAVYAATLIRREMLPAVEPSEKRPGVEYQLFVPSNDFGQDTVPQKGESRSIFLTQFAQRIDLKKSFAVTYEGYINAPADGVYEFQVDSTWDATIVLDGKTIIDEAGTKDRTVKSTIMPLKTGWHRVSLRYNHRGGDAAFRVRWGFKGQGLRQIGGGELVH